METSTSTLSVTLHRFYLNESKAVRFSSTDDSLIALFLVLTAFTITHGIYFLIQLLHPLSLKDATLVKKGFWDLFMQDSATLVGILLGAWMLGYCFVSWTVFYQFEAREGRPADDYVMLNVFPENDDANDDLNDDDDEGEGGEMKKDENGNRIELEIVPSGISLLPNGAISFLYDPRKKEDALNNI
jgi:hypothetical protein